MTASDPRSSARRGGAAGEPLPGRRELVTEIGRVAAEQLVRAFAGENDLDVFACRLCQQPRGQHRRVAEWLAEGAGHPLERTAERRVVPGPDATGAGDLVRDGLGVPALVAGPPGEPDTAP